MAKPKRSLKKIFAGAAASSAILLGGCVSPGGLQGRSLTRSETEMARTVFGDTVNYDNVKVYNGPPTVAGIFHLNQDGLSAISPNGDVYIVGPQYQVQDLSQASADTRKLLIHELTHVWQHQQGRNVEAEALFLFIKSGGHYNAAYAYDINGNQKFADLNLEQQAHMVEDYFALREMSPWEAPPDRDERIAKFEAMLKPHLPLTATTPQQVTPQAAPPPPQTKAPKHPRTGHHK